MDLFISTVIGLLLVACIVYIVYRILFPKLQEPRISFRDENNRPYTPKNISVNLRTSTKRPNRRLENSKGRQAPEGYYFDDQDRLFTITGDLVLDILLLTELFGDDWNNHVYYDNQPEDLVDGVDAAPVEQGVEDVLAGNTTMVEPNTPLSEATEETRREPSPTITTPAPEPAPSYEPAEESTRYNSGGDSYSSYDSGGGSFDSGGDCGCDDD